MYKLGITMTLNILCDLPRHQWRPAFFAAWICRGIVDSLGWCCSRPFVQFFCQIHFEPVVFFWLPFLNGLSYRVPVALDRKIIWCRLRISCNKISFTEISSSYGPFSLLLHFLDTAEPAYIIFFIYSRVKLDSRCLYFFIIPSLL